MAQGFLDSDPLPLNFPQTFLPDRRLLARLLPFADSAGSGDKVEIGAATGIPTGESTGKVEPMIHYARGMGLIHTGKTGGQWTLSLTPLGRLVLAEDPYLSESVTLWLLHLLLCRRYGLDEPASGIADAWFALFAESHHRLGSRFDQAAYHDYLIERHGGLGYLKNLSGLVLRTYQETSCFGGIDVLHADAESNSGRYQRGSAPIDRSFFPAYAVYLWLVWDALYPDHDQLAMEDFFKSSRCLAAMGWDRAIASEWLDWLADRGQLQLDRQTGATLALRLKDTASVVRGLYDELI